MKKLIIYSSLIIALAGAGCNKLLEEEAKSILTPEFLSTEKGVNAGVDAAYAGNRFLWGNQDLFTLTVIGTDEFQRGVDGNTDVNNYASNYTNNNGQGNNIWSNSYKYINACNGVIKYAPLAEMDANVKKVRIAESKFLRAQYYFVLAQFFRDVTIYTDFVDQPLTAAKREPLADVYALIIKDLNEAITDLPAGPRSSGVQVGRTSSAAARHLLAKVYLTKAGSPAKAANDYEQAYTVAKDLIDKKGTYGLNLLQDFKDVHAEGNENNTEVIWTVQHTSNLAYNGPNNSSGADNVLNHMFVGQYDKLGLKRSKEYGRPYIRCVPTRWTTETAFKERVNDTRYAKSFQTIWFANSTASVDIENNKWPNPLPAGAPPGAVAGAPKIKKIGDTAIYMPGVDKTDQEIAVAPYLMIPPRKYSSQIAPTVTKYFDAKKAGLNDPSIRPVIVYRFAETYLIAAEAALMTARPTEAANYINAVRERAAWPSGSAAAMRVTAADMTAGGIDFILDERTRELVGENIRWWDLVRTGKLIERVKLYNGDAATNIQPRHILRPIPLNQLNRVTTGEPYNNDLYFPDWN
jgi:starch-binding outer membrane protein, SusD/RagB family